MNIKVKNSFVYLYGFPEYDWCDSTISKTSDVVQYFPLNIYTRELFKIYVLPLMRKGIVSYNEEEKETIRTFVQNPLNKNPISLTKIPGGITLFDHQLKALAEMFKHNKFGFFYGTGTGKTLIAITWLMNVRPKSCLIVTPQKVVGQYKEEIEKYVPGSPYEVTNFEQLHKITKQYDALIVDESHRAKNYSSIINENLRRISKAATYCYIFTGTPSDKSRHEILPQLAILDDRVMPVKTKVYERYFTINDYFRPEKEKKSRSEELTQIILEYTIGVKTEDVVDLPPENNVIMNCDEPGSEYQALFNDRILIVKRNGKEYRYVADTKALLRLGLKELCSGYLKMEDIDGNPEYLSFENTLKLEKLSLLTSKIPNAIIYYEYTHSIKDITDILERNNRTYVIVNGETSANKSQTLINEFKTGMVDYLVIQSRSGNAGLDLTNVNTIIFYALPDSFITFKQAKSRIRRIGQKKECNYYYLICKNTVEKAIYNALKNKKTFNDGIFSAYYNRTRRE